MNLRVDFSHDAAGFNHCPDALKRQLGSQFTIHVGDDLKTGKAVIVWSTFNNDDEYDKTRPRKLTPDQPGEKKLVRKVTPDTHLKTLQQVAVMIYEAQVASTTYCLNEAQAKACLRTQEGWDDKRVQERLTRLRASLDDCPALGDKVISFSTGQPYLKGTSYPHDCDANLRNIVKGIWSLAELDDIVSWVTRAITKAEKLQVEVVDIFLKGDVGKKDPATLQRTQFRGSYLIIRLANKSDQNQMCDLEFFIGDYTDTGVEGFDTEAIANAFSKIAKAKFKIDRKDHKYAKELNLGNYSVTILRGKV